MQVDADLHDREAGADAGPGEPALDDDDVLGVDEASARADCDAHGGGGGQAHPEAVTEHTHGGGGQAYPEAF